ncbi:MAG: hypothetical protein FJ271_03185 [Planctomycetes bacterium]|nr:hypothetical protein [Planctomycetota bacterium]
MRITTLVGTATCLLLCSMHGSFAQTGAVQDEVEAVLALNRAGALVLFDKGGAIHVSLSGIKTANRLLSHVKMLSSLESLELAGTEVNDKSLSQISGLTKLRSLNLTSSRVGDNGLQHLRGMTKLTSLSLHGTKVGDEGLRHLKTLGMLKTLIVKDTKVTAAGAGKLLELLPKISIIGVKEWETGFIRVEMEGTLSKQIIDRKEHWTIQVKTARLGEISWPLDFLSNPQTQRAAQQLDNKTVVITGEIVRDLHVPGIGGESFLIPPPGPIVLVRSLRAAEM